MRGIFETLFVFGIMAGLLLPARLLFVQYVSDNWFGSAGIISVISLLIIVLAKKQKLGFFGPMLERQIYKFQKGKRGILIFGESIFVIMLLGGMIVVIDQGNTVHFDLKPQNQKNFSSDQLVVKQTEELNMDDWFDGFLIAPAVFVTEFPKMSAAIASIDQESDGWLLHFYTVGFIEYVELLGILVCYKISFMRKTPVGASAI